MTRSVRGRKWAILSVFVTVMGAAAAPADAATFVTTVDMFPDSSAPPGDILTISESAQDVSNSTLYGTLSAKVDFGVVKVHSTYNAPDAGPNTPGLHYMGGGNQVIASTTDYLSIVAPQGVTSGTFTAKVFIDGTVVGNSSNTFSGPAMGATGGGEAGMANAEIQVYLPMTGATPLDVRYQSVDYGGFRSSQLAVNGQPSLGALPGTYTFDVAFSNLDPIQIQLSVTCGSSGNTIYSGQFGGGDCALDHSIYWGGVVGARDQNGDAIAGFGLTGASGFNYANQSPAYVPPSGAPEPAAWAMILLGFGLGGAGLRLKRTAVV